MKRVLRSLPLVVVPLTLNISFMSFNESEKLHKPDFFPIMSGNPVKCVGVPGTRREDRTSRVHGNDIDYLFNFTTYHIPQIRRFTVD